jgi:hypothetical protein
MSQRRELEKLTGLDNLFGDDEEKSLSDSTLPLSQIILPPSQPRRYFDPIKLKSLADSIKSVGLLKLHLNLRGTPVTVADLAVTGDRRVIDRVKH